jgi:hypothetical protein
MDQDQDKDEEVTLVVGASLNSGVRGIRTTTSSNATEAVNKLLPPKLRPAPGVPVAAADSPIRRPKRTIKIPRRFLGDMIPYPHNRRPLPRPSPQ